MICVYWTVKVYLIAWWNFFGSSLPFACLIALYVVLLPLRWSSIYWWEQMRCSSIYWWEHMREVLVVNRREMIPLHSLLGLDFTFYLGFSLGLRPVYCIVLKTLFWIQAISYSFWVVGVVVNFSIFFHLPWINVRSDLILHNLALYIIRCKISFNYVII